MIKDIIDVPMFGVKMSLYMAGYFGGVAADGLWTAFSKGWINARLTR